MTETAKEPISNEIIPDYWIISGQVFKNKERFVKQQMEFNPGDIRENWGSSFDHFAIPVYRNPIFVSEYENGVKTSFVRQNKIFQEQLNTAKKALTEIAEFDCCDDCYSTAYEALIEIDEEFQKNILKANEFIEEAKKRLEGSGDE